MTARPLLPSGIPPLDRQIGGLAPGRPYLVSGSPGTGKSVSCLEFLDVAIQAGEKAVLLTHDDPADVLSSAEFLGIDIEPALLEGRLTILKFQLDFIRRFGRATTPDEVFTELKAMIGTPVPSRLAIDSVVPFLEGGGASSAAVFALTQFLEQFGATSLLTYPGDLAGLYDRRLEPLMQRAGGLFHLSAQSQGRRRGTLEIRKLRYEAPSVAPVQFRIGAGAGFVQVGVPNAPEDELAEEERNHLLLVSLSTPFPSELREAVERTFRLTTRAGVASAFSDLVHAGAGAVLLNVRRDVINDALQLVRELRRSGVRTPVALVTPYTLRATDRTRALRAGADDFLSLNLAPSEFVARVHSLTRRGRAPMAYAEADVPAIAQPTGPDGRYQLLDVEAFGVAASAVLSREAAPYFSVVQIHCDAAESRAVGALVLATARVDSGDLVGQGPGGTILLLADGARPRDLQSLCERISKQWASTGSPGALRFDLIGYPEEDARLQDLLGVGVT